MTANAMPVIAIDGPTASGKGTVAQRIAETLGFHYLDSGSLYRLVALAATGGGIDLNEESALATLAAGLEVRFAEGRIWMDEREVTDEIRTEVVSQNASRVASLPKVREALLKRQRNFRQSPGLVCDGRDMGSVVFPDATAKFFLTASVEARAERRTKQLNEKGMSAIMADVVKELRARDERDSNRPVAPLKHYSDAYLIDTTDISADFAVDRILSQYRKMK